MLRILLMILAVLPAAASARDPAVEALDGAWIVQVGDEPRDRFLIVSGAKRERNLVTPASASYGWIDSRATAVREWKAEIAGDSIRLGFITPADSRVEVEFKADETTVSGSIVYKSGRKFTVRMTRIGDDELKAVRAARAAARKPAPPMAKVGKDEKIYLVYVSSYDCPSCSWFRGNYLDGDRRKLRAMIPELDSMEFVNALLGTYRAPLSAGIFPDQLKWLGTPNAAGRFPLNRRGVPFFAGVVGNRVIAQGHGVTGLESLVVPALRQAAASRARQ